MQLQLLALIVFWLSRSKILADEESITSRDDDFIVSKAGSACAEDGEAAAEENCSGLMQDAADNKDAFIYPAAAASAAAVVPPPASAATASITRKPMPFATRLESVGTGQTMTIPQRTDAVISVQQNDRKLTTNPPSHHPPPPPPSPCAPTAAAAGDKDCAAFNASPSPQSASGPGREDKVLTSDLPVHPAIPENKREKGRERKNSPLPPTSQPPAAKASAKASQTIVGINQTDGTKEKRPSLEGATIHIIDNDDGDDDDGVDSSSSSLVVVGDTGSTITTSGVSQTTLVDREHPLSLYINLHTLLIVAIAGGGLSILLLLLIIAVCRCSSRGRRPKNPSTMASSKPDRGKSYPYEACNTLPPRPAPSTASDPCHGTLPLTPDFYLVKNSVINSSSSQYPAHLSSAHSQRPVALVATSGAATIDPLIFKTTAKKDVKEWYV